MFVLFQQSRDDLEAELNSSSQMPTSTPPVWMLDDPGNNASNGTGVVLQINDLMQPRFTALFSWLCIPVGNHLACSQSSYRNGECQASRLSSGFNQHKSIKSTPWSVAASTVKRGTFPAVTSDT